MGVRRRREKERERVVDSASAAAVVVVVYDMISRAVEGLTVSRLSIRYYIHRQIDLSALLHIGTTELIT